MKRLLFAAFTLSLAAFIPATASAGGVWTDGNYYAACPDFAYVQTTRASGSNGWNDDFRGDSAQLRSFTAAYVIGAIGGDMLVCTYGSPNFQGLLRMDAPAAYPNCTAYNGPWFICTK